MKSANFEKSIQTAFREVADGLAGKQTLDDQVAAQNALVVASSESYKLSDMRFRAGIDNYLTVIVSQRALYSAQQDLVSIELLKMQNLVTLYKALGRGLDGLAQKIKLTPEPHDLKTGCPLDDGGFVDLSTVRGKNIASR